MYNARLTPPPPNTYMQFHDLKKSQWSNILFKANRMLPS